MNNAYEYSINVTLIEVLSSFETQDLIISVSSAFKGRDRRNRGAPVALNGWIPLLKYLSNHLDSKSVTKI